MKKGVIFIDRFSAGLDDLSIKDAGNYAVVLQTLDRIKRFSVFEATANPTIANTMTGVFKRGYVKDLGGGYPWTNVELTDAGRSLIAESTIKAMAPGEKP